MQEGKIYEKYERCDLVAYVCGQFPIQKNRSSWLHPTEPHENYTGGRRLEAIEIHLHEIDDLIQKLYRTLDCDSEKTVHPVIQPIKEGELINLVQERRIKLARYFPPRFAKLHSHSSRLRNRQAGLPSWRVGEAEDRLNEAVQLLHAAFIERDANPEGDWYDSARRAGELLEWLAHPKINTKELPIRLLSAASYQLAGYPARASGLLNARILDDNESRILFALLKPDFVALQRELANYWSDNISSVIQPMAEGFESPFDNIHRTIVTETVRALGVLCAEMRWGHEDRLEKAVEKLTGISKMMLHGTDPYAWLLAKLCVEVVSTYINASMRTNLVEYLVGMNPRGEKAVEN